MVDKVSICNQALGWLSADLISSFEDKSKEGYLCASNFDELRDAVLTERIWTFASKVIELEPTEVLPGGYGNAYGIPPEAQVILIYRVYEDISPGVLKYAEWFREGQNIISPYGGTLYAQCITNDISPQEMSPLFRQALAARLAADFSITLTQNRQLQLDMWNLYQQKLTEAAASDSRQGRTELLRSSILTGVRAAPNILGGGGDG
jgi:hypothetical protein